MTQGLTLELAAVFLVFAAGAVGIVIHYYNGMARLHARINDVKKELHARIDVEQAALHAFQITAAEKYATYEHTAEVERRLTRAVDAGREDVKEGFKDVNGRLDKLLLSLRPRRVTPPKS